VTVLRLRRIFCASCARPLRRGTYLRCVLGCGARLCRTGSCIQQHVPNCPVRQNETGIGLDGIA
jgi:hypothetical protein